MAAHDAMELAMPGLRAHARRIAGRLRARPGWPSLATVSGDELAREPMFLRYLEQHERMRIRLHGMAPGKIARETRILAMHLHYLVNHELHHCKTFYIDEALAWMLCETDLTIDGATLKPPFPACAFIYTDSFMCGGAHAARLAGDPSTKDDAPPRIVTAYAVYDLGVKDGAELTVYLLLGEPPGEWPFIFGRTLFIRPQDSLEQIVESRSPLTPEQDPFFLSPEFTRLMRIVLNSILFATTAHLNAVKIPAGGTRRTTADDKPQPPQEAAAAPPVSFASSDDVFYLPARINISQYRRLRELDKSPTGRTLKLRFMVRGHWRRPNKSWKDSRLRWIAPYWKGPADAPIIEKGYRMKP
ncbi:MAG TPA: hypothetical protein DCM87_08110 [Planctomycetes bacterium]|nr:hypothetical protein [Planctomycetota bacterium]